MIYSLTGILEEKNLDEVVINVNGVGYLIAVPTTAMTFLGVQGEKCTLYTYLNVKEDALDLYGFTSKEEQSCFKTLISVSGVGPKVGLAILSILSPSKIALAITTGDFKALNAAQGVGPKLAQRIVLELKGKFNQATFEEVSIGDVQTVVNAGGNISQATNALIALGYTQSQAALALAKLDAGLSVQDLIKQALKLIAGGKI